MGHIFLYGPPASGKSSIGKVLAENLNLPFVDLDALTKQAAGADISQIMADRGEAGFRDIESAELTRILSNPDSVVALGSGTLLRVENRKSAESHGIVVYLDADVPVLLDHLEGDAKGRPWLEGVPANKLTALMVS